MRAARFVAGTGLLIVALIASPIVLDACAIGCTAARGPSAAMGGHCHMPAAGTTLRAATSCGHDHHATSATGAAAGPGLDRPGVAAVLAVAAPAAAQASARLVRSNSPPGPSPHVVAQLRI